jgi:hypothetical protein
MRCPLPGTNAFAQLCQVSELPCLAHFKQLLRGLGPAQHNVWSIRCQQLFSTQPCRQTASTHHYTAASTYAATSHSKRILDWRKQEQLAYTAQQHFACSARRCKLTAALKSSSTDSGQRSSGLWPSYGATCVKHAARVWPVGQIAVGAHGPRQQLLQQPWVQNQSRSVSQLFSSSSSYSTASTSTTTNTSTSSEPPKNLKGSLPGSGPSHKTLRALPFTVSRSAAADAFASYHGRHWYQSRQRPLLAKPFKETFLPFWVASGVVRVEVTGAEVGHEHMVTR